MAIEIQRNGILFVVSSPSGGGKSSVIRALLKDNPGLDYSVSVTSRPSRPGEVDGESYTFVSEEKFRKWIEEGRFYEWAKVHNHYYGTRKDVIQEKLSQGRDVIMDLDFQGGLNVKQQSPSSVLIFLLPPSMEELENRLRSRGTDSEEVIRVRLKNAREEMRYASKYDYILINDRLETAISETGEIIHAEGRRAGRLTIKSDNVLLEAVPENRKGEK